MGSVCISMWVVYRLSLEQCWTQCPAVVLCYGWWYKNISSHFVARRWISLNLNLHLSHLSSALSRWLGLSMIAFSFPRHLVTTELSFLTCLFIVFPKERVNIRSSAHSEGPSLCRKNCLDVVLPAHFECSQRNLYLFTFPTPSCVKSSFHSVTYAPHMSC